MKFADGQKRTPFAQKHMARRADKKRPGWVGCKMLGASQKSKAAFVCLAFRNMVLGAGSDQSLYTVALGNRVQA